MSEIADAVALRELFLSAPESGASRVVAAVLGLLVLSVVLFLVRRRALREEYTPIWLAVAFSMAFLGMNFGALRMLTRWIGAWTPSATVFFLGEVFLIAISLNYAVRLSRANLQLKNLAQEAAILRTRVERLEADFRTEP
ncbi:MAG: DUF2304 domain-containing protein [bacterium]|nr:DUF2304 domain-containing protein [bacterium]